MELQRVLVQFAGGTEHVITGDIQYETTTDSRYPWQEVTIRVRAARIVLDQSQPEQIDLAPCHKCGAPQGPLHLTHKAG